ncbi:MAG: M48 family metallopeptidase [Actinomycetota bacterium]|nr:M48 family metallopeptidase [Actinomycetota bacterium]
MAIAEHSEADDPLTALSPPLPLVWHDDADVAGDGRRPAVEVRSSGRRKRSSVAYWEGDKVVVVVPARLPRATQRDTVDWLVGRLLAKTPGIVASDADLEERAIALADRYLDHVRPTSIRWATNQTRRWGSCSPESGQIRISERLRRVPGWVLDAIIVHELAHLVIADHSGAFRALADRYPRQHDAARFLDGYALGLARPVDPGVGCCPA